MSTFQQTLLDVQRGVDLSQRLSKIAEYFADDEQVKTAALEAKIAVNAEVFDLVKCANYGQMASKGLAYAGLPILGAGAVGYGLLEKAKGDAAEATADIRNKVLQTGLGLGAIGAGLYGLHRAVGSGPILGQQKTSEDAESIVAELVTKLAAVAKIEEDLARVDLEKLSEAARAEALEVRLLNQDYGVRLLYEASH